jgi:hypothetical protein
MSKGMFKDLTLKATDTTVKAHKLVLAPQSEFLMKSFIKHPSKKDIAIPFNGSILRALVRYSYQGNYLVDSRFESEWKLKHTGAGASDMEYHFKVLQLAMFMGMPKLEELAGQKLKNGLKTGKFGDELLAKLQELPPKKAGDKKSPAPEVPFAVTEAVIEGGARTVKQQVDHGLELNAAFHSAARSIDSRFLADFIQCVGNALGQQFRLYLRCPNCACHIRSKEGGSKDFACIRDDCGQKGKSALGHLLPDDRIANPFAQPVASSTTT